MVPVLQKGCSQGSVLGPQLWNIGFNSFIQYFEENGILVTCYADDTLFVVAADDLARLEEKVVSVLTRATMVLSDAGPELSSAKTDLMVVNGRSYDKIETTR